MTKQETIYAIADAIDGEKYAAIELWKSGSLVYTYHTNDEPDIENATVEYFADVVFEEYTDVLSVDRKSALGGIPCAVVEVR